MKARFGNTLNMRLQSNHALGAVAARADWSDFRRHVHKCHFEGIEVSARHGRVVRLWGVVDGVQTESICPGFKRLPRTVIGDVYSKPA